MKPRKPHVTLPHSWGGGVTSILPPPSQLVDPVTHTAVNWGAVAGAKSAAEAAMQAAAVKRERKRLARLQARRK